MRDREGYCCCNDAGYVPPPQSFITQDFVMEPQKEQGQQHMIDLNKAEWCKMYLRMA